MNNVDYNYGKRNLNDLPYSLIKDECHLARKNGVRRSFGVASEQMTPPVRKIKVHTTLFLYGLLFWIIKNYENRKKVPSSLARKFISFISKDDWYEVSEENDVTTSIPVRLEITVTQVG